jgi:WhiB family redox-sensing transcriptional regulator
VTAVLIDQPTSVFGAEQAFAPAQRSPLSGPIAMPAPKLDGTNGAAVAAGGGWLDSTSVDTQTPAHLCSDLPCQRSDADLWFSDTPAGLEDAKAQCAPCPLRSSCLEGALERREPWGVWGGEILERGVVIGRKRPRGRPRKVAA